MAVTPAVEAGAKARDLVFVTSEVNFPPSTVLSIGAPRTSSAPAHQLETSQFFLPRAEYH
jgi:hypothetical protein